MILLIFLFNILMATTFTFSKAALWYLNPLTLITVRFLVSGMCLLGYLWYKDRNSLYIPIKDWNSFFLIMLVPFYGAFVTDNWSLQFISSSKSCLIYNLMPLVTAIIAYIQFGKKINGLQLLALFLGFTSLMFVFETAIETPLSVGVLNIDALPELVLLLSVALAAWGWLLIQQMLVAKNYSLLLVNGIGLFGAGILSSLHLIVLWMVDVMPFILPGALIVIIIYTWQAITKKEKEGYSQLLVGIVVLLFVSFIYRLLFYSPMYAPTAAVVWQPNEHDQLFSMISSMLPFTISYWVTLSFYVGWLIVAGHIVGYMLYGYLLKIYSATFLAFAGSTIPLFAAALGALFLQETVSKGFAISFLLMTASILLFYSQEKKG